MVQKFFVGVSFWIFFLKIIFIYFTKISDVVVADDRQWNPKRSSLTSLPDPDKSNKHQFYMRFFFFIIFI